MHQELPISLEKSPLEKLCLLYLLKQPYGKSVLFFSSTILSHPTLPLLTFEEPPHLLWAGVIAPCSWHLREILLVLEDRNDCTIKILQGLDTASGTIPQRRCFRTWFKSKIISIFQSFQSSQFKVINKMIVLVSF